MYLKGIFRVTPVSGGCLSVCFRAVLPRLRSAGPRASPVHPPIGEPTSPQTPPPRKGRGAATHWLRRLPRAQYPAQEPPPGAPQATPQFASAPQPRRSALRAPRPCHSPLIFLRPLTLIPLPSRSRAAPRAEPTATPRAVPEAQPPLLLEPHQRELLAAAIMVS